MSIRIYRRAFLACALALAAGTGRAAAKDPVQTLDVNFFRSPSMGLEYFRAGFSLNLGFYPTIISKDSEGDNETTWFTKVGATFFFLPVPLGGSGGRESSFFFSVAYLRGLNNDWENAFSTEAGFRWYAWQGLNIRLGGLLLYSPDHSLKINPTPGIGYSFLL